MITSPDHAGRHSAVLGMVGAFLALAAVAVAVFALASLLEGVGIAALAAPGAWLRSLDPAWAADLILSAAEPVAAVLAIAITVSAIIVELAANRYNHRITRLFVRDPVNIAMLGLLMITTLLCLWIPATRDPQMLAAWPNAAFAVMLVLISVSLLALLPYFAYVFAFLSPINIIAKIRFDAQRWIRTVSRGNSRASGGTRAPAPVRTSAPERIGRMQHRVLEAVDELQDVARSAIEQSDRSIAMACVSALKDLLMDYQTLRDSLPAEWFRLYPGAAEDPDFVSLARSAVRDIEDQGLWFEVKVMRQYLALMTHCVPGSRDVANLVAIHSGTIGMQPGAGNAGLLRLVIRCFNSYLRTTINAADPRTTYYVMNQYRRLAVALMAQSAHEQVLDIARHFRFYGVYAHQRGLSFLLEVTAHDLAQLVEASLVHAPSITDELLAVVLDLDQDLRAETHEESLLGVRRAQLQLATLFLARAAAGPTARDAAAQGVVARPAVADGVAVNSSGTDDARALRICHDLAEESMPRLLRLRAAIELETDPYYWEFTDRNVNFGYFEPERRAQLSRAFDWIEQAQRMRPV